VCVCVCVCVARGTCARRVRPNKIREWTTCCCIRGGALSSFRQRDPRRRYRWHRSDARVLGRTNARIRCSNGRFRKFIGPRGTFEIVVGRRIILRITLSLAVVIGRLVDPNDPLREREIRGKCPRNWRIRASGTAILIPRFSDTRSITTHSHHLTVGSEVAKVATTRFACPPTDANIPIQRIVYTITIRSLLLEIRCTNTGFGPMKNDVPVAELGEN